MFTRYALCNSSMKQIRPVVFSYAQCAFSTNNNDNLINTYKHDSTILTILNQKTTRYLTRFKIPKLQAQALQSHREKHGLYKSLPDVLEVEGMTETILEEFIDATLSEKQYQRKEKFRNSVLIPKMSSISKEKISTVLGIYVGLNIVSWTQLGIKENVLEWNYENLLSLGEIKNFNTLHLLQMAQQINNKLPRSDVYVVDEINFDYRIAKTIRHLKPFLHKQQLKAMILASLQSRNAVAETENELTRKFYLTQHEKVAQMYGLRIGNEITASSKIIEKLLHERNDVNGEKKNSISVYISQNIMNNYKSQMDYVKDQMNWSLLTALTFLQLTVHEKFYYEFT